MAGFDLTDKVAIITGGSRGIGRAIALAFADAGAKIVLASRKQEGLDVVAGEIRERGGTALAVAAHVGQEEALAHVVQRAVETFGAGDYPQVRTQALRHRFLSPQSTQRTLRRAFPLLSALSAPSAVGYG